MPTPAIIAGLVLGAVLGTSALCLGAYFVHRYMDLQCRKIKRWFQRDTVSRKNYDIESRGRYEAERANATPGKKRKQRSRAAMSQGDGYGSWDQRHTSRLRGEKGYAEWADNAERVDEKKMHSHNSLLVSNRNQVGQPQPIGWNYPTWPHEHVWYPSACYHEMPPQCAVYVPLRPGLMVYPEAAFPQPLWVDPKYAPHRTAQVDQQQHRKLEALWAEARSRPRSREGLQVRAQAEPIAFESDGIQVIMKHPRAADDAHKQKEKGEKHKTKDAWRQRHSSTESTCSSRQDLSSVEDVPRDSIPSGAPHYVRFPTCDYPQYPKRSAKVWDDGDQYVRRSQRNEGRQGRNNIDDVRCGRRRHYSVSDGRQTSRATFQPYAQTSGSGREYPPTICQCEGEDPVQSGDAARDCTGVRTTNSKTGSTNGEDGTKTKGTVNEVSGCRGEYAGSVGFTKPKAYRGLATAAVGSVLSDVVTEEPSSDTATVGKKGKASRQPPPIIEEPASDIAPTRSRSRMFLNVFHTDSTRTSVPSAPASLDDTMSLPGVNRSAGGRTGRDSRWSVTSAEASFYIDERN